MLRELAGSPCLGAGVVLWPGADGRVPRRLHCSSLSSAVGGRLGARPREGDLGATVRVVFAATQCAADRLWMRNPFARRWLQCRFLRRSPRLGVPRIPAVSRGGGGPCGALVDEVVSGLGKTIVGVAGLLACLILGASVALGAVSSGTPAGGRIRQFVQPGKTQRNGRSALPARSAITGPARVPPATVEDVRHGDRGRTARS